MRALLLLPLLVLLAATNAFAADEVLKISAFADFYQCRHSFGDRCLVQLHHSPNVEISMSQTSVAPETWEGKLTRDNSYFGIDAVVELEGHKDIDPRVNPEPHYSIRARVVNRKGEPLIPWISVSWFGDAMFNGLNAKGPSFKKVEADLYEANLFIYLGKPFVPANY